MAMITPALLAALRTGFKGEFQRVYNETPSNYADIATTITSKTASNTFGWLGQFPSMQEWIGDRVLKDMAAHGYTITNKKFESTVAVARTDIEDDSLGIYKPLVAEMGRAAKVHPDQLCFGLLKQGTTALCYDGQPFFDTDHPVYPNVDGTGTALTVSNFATGTDPAWYLLDNSRALKAVIYQERTKPEFESLTDTADEYVFMKDMYRYGVRVRCNVGFAFWQLAYCSKLPLTEANLDAAYDAMAAWTADGGRPLGIRPTHLVVPTNLRKAAAEAVEVSRKANGADNPNAGLVKTIVTPWLN
ncbi:Mu-like prophage major head subunit gpT family protein [Desulfovibrio sp. OttesenSCG-928-G15]|nr:Mu-like prophage major head subunit gpT family protein [Desulfovibrio sp. OttesenSCG-928-G15]